MQTSLEMLRKSAAPITMRLVIAPHAAASAFAYHWLARLLPPGVECLGIEYPGRGTLHDQPLATNIPVLARDVAQQICELEGDIPLVLFGHSLGSFIAYETSGALGLSGFSNLRLLIVSAQRGPRVRPRPPLTSTLDDRMITETLRELGSLPETILEDPEALEQLLPVLRHDARACEIYMPSFAGPVAVPLSIYGGDQDAGVTSIDLVSWKAMTTRSAALRIFSGGHFYYTSSQENFIKTLNADMQDAAAEN